MHKKYTKRPNMIAMHNALNFLVLGYLVLGGFSIYLALWDAYTIKFNPEHHDLLKEMIQREREHQHKYEDLDLSLQIISTISEQIPVITTEQELHEFIATKEMSTGTITNNTDIDARIYVMNAKSVNIPHNSHNNN